MTRDADWLDTTPEHATVKATVRKGSPFCGTCGRLLPHRDAWRCPYVNCRVWLRGLDTLTRDERAKLPGHQ